MSTRKQKILEQLDDIASECFSLIEKIGARINVPNDFEAYEEDYDKLSVVRDLLKEVLDKCE